MKRTVLMKQSGPYRVRSYANGELCVTPKWSQFPKYKPKEGGGPGVMSRIGLASDIERFLNGKAKGKL